MKTLPTLALALVLAPLATLPAADSPEQKPNIIVILADDLGWADLPAYGNRFNEAPGLDRMAREGMRFTQAYSAAPVCSPTRAALMSGQHPARVGVIDFIPGHWRPFEKLVVPKNRQQFLPQKIVTIAEALRSAGYATALFGKWHLGDGPKHHPLTQGFDEANVGGGYFNTVFDPARPEGEEKIVSERLTDFVIDFIGRHREQPFFVVLSHWDVHCLLDAEPDLIRKYQAKQPDSAYTSNPIYAATIEHLDRSTGRLLDKLDEWGMAENTVIVFTSDNGGCITENPYPGTEEEGKPGGHMNMVMPSKREMIPDHPHQYIVTSNLPLRGEKGQVYEGGIRVPLIVRWPNHVKAGATTTAPAVTHDLFPTFLEIAGAANPDGQPTDGISLAPALLRGEFDPARPLFWHYPVYHHAAPAAAVRVGDWKLIRHFEDDSVELFNLVTDPGEQSDLSATFPEKRKELEDALAKCLRDTGAEIPTPNPAFDPARRFEWANHPDRAVR
jgi:arylsulfatase A